MPAKSVIGTSRGKGWRGIGMQAGWLDGFAYPTVPRTPVGPPPPMGN